MKGIDSNVDLTEVAGALVAAGYSFCARYLPCSTKSDPLTRAEAQHLSDMGLSIVSLWESGFPLRSGYFTHDQGVRDAANALLGAQAVGQTEICPVFFCVDYDADPADVMGYFEAIHLSPLHEMFLPAVYGGPDVCRTLADAGLAHFTMLCQSRGFRANGGPFVNWNLAQGPQQFLALGGKRIDVDTQVSRGDNFGQWSLVPTKGSLNAAAPVRS